ncbi:MAG TPA: LuxR C-terminal-related transcriptional regulator [Solirubrobacteraceae bacterium]|nr:LuxR C-terminal-related transcriptional regulator [Solirubrobacteraceae bacterium]
MWSDAYQSLMEADEATGLGADDLERLATAAYMLGRDLEHIAALERAHQAHVEGGRPARAARCAFWLTIALLLRGQLGPATGWLGRGERLVAGVEGDCVERGYLLMPHVIMRQIAGDRSAALATAAEAGAIAERFGEGDLHALAGVEHGRSLLLLGHIGDGLRMLDEAMVGAARGELSPIVTGLVYCSVIDACQSVYELRRAQEWTAALTQWCEEQRDMIAFTGRCLVHRAEILQLHGAWDDALREARRAGTRPGRAAGQAHYRCAEVHRLHGDLSRAEDAYRDASRSGTEPQPGLALLRRDQGDTNAAAAAIRRALAEAAEPIDRLRLLPAGVEIMLAAGELESARALCEELERLAPAFASTLLDALVGHARGAVELAAGDARGALPALRAAGRAWQELSVPYEGARVRVLLGRACRALGDADSATLELEAARETFSALAATPDVERVDALLDRADDRHGLTARELEVLRLVAAGETNKAIAATLVLSERTVDRHVSNIFVKLGTASRTAATAYAYRHGLV